PPVRLFPTSSRAPAKRACRNSRSISKGISREDREDRNDAAERRPPARLDGDSFRHPLALTRPFSKPKSGVVPIASTFLLASPLGSSRAGGRRSNRSVPTSHLELGTFLVTLGAW